MLRPRLILQHTLALILALFVLAWAVHAQDAATPPVVTEVQRLKVQTLSQRLENAQLKMQLLQADFEKTRLELAALVQSLQVPGYALTEDLTYAKTPPPGEAPK